MSLHRLGSLFAVMTLAACIAGPEPALEEGANSPLRDGCTGDHCIDEVLAALISLAWTGDADVLSAPATGRAARMTWGYRVIDGHGALVSGAWNLARKCGVWPDDCYVQLFSRQTIAGTTSEAVVGAMYGDWRWFWRNSASSAWAQRADLDQPSTAFVPAEQTFHPLAALRDRVTVRTLLEEPEKNGADPLPALDDATGARFERWDYKLPLSLSGDFTGQAYVLVSARDGVVTVREVWPAMQITGAVKRLPALAAVLHLWAVSSRTPRGLVGGDEFGLDGHSGWAGLADAIEEGVHPGPGQAPYTGRIHETVGDEHRLRQDATGAWIIEGSSTVDFIDAPLEAVRAAIFGDFSCWWRHGRVTNLRPDVDAAGQVVGLRYHLDPILIGGAPLASVDEHMFVPEALVDGYGRAGWRIRIELEGPDFRGPAHFDVIDRGDGRTQVVARFDAVRPQGPWGLSRRTAEQAMKNHVRAQEGTMPLALAGSGLPGLVTLLERGELANWSASCL